MNVNMFDPIVSAELGSFSNFPLEVREKIYAYCLDFDNAGLPSPYSETCCPDCRGEVLPSCSLEASRRLNPMTNASLLRVSRRMHDEAIVIMYRTNNFCVHIDHEIPVRTNVTIMGNPGFRSDFAHAAIARYYGYDSRAFLSPSQMPSPYLLSQIRSWTIVVGSRFGLMEQDIVPDRMKSRQGPERPEFQSLMKQVRALCNMLKTCYQIHDLRISIRSIERKPGRFEDVIRQFLELRNVRSTEWRCFSSMNDGYTYWTLKTEYMAYLSLVMSMPKDSPAPASYFCEANRQKSKFQRLNGIFVTGSGVPIESGSDTNSEDEELSDEENDDDYDDDSWEDEDEDEIEDDREFFEEMLDEMVQEMLAGMDPNVRAMGPAGWAAAGLGGAPQGPNGVNMGPF